LSSGLTKGRALPSSALHPVNPVNPVKDLRLFCNKFQRSGVTTRRMPRDFTAPAHHQPR
jgi:hypothetical protein